MNTHDKYELPPLPEWVDWPVTVSEMTASEIKEAMQDYAREAIEADRKRRGEAVAWVAADTLYSAHPTCISSLAYMSQIDHDRGREYVPLAIINHHATPAAQERQPAKNQHPIASVLACAQWLRSIGIEPTYTLDGDFSGDACRARWEAWQAALKWSKNHD